MTLRELIERHPEWADFDVTVMDTDGSLHYIDYSAVVFVGEDEDGAKVLVMSHN